jgi:hypothetical protein
MDHWARSPSKAVDQIRHFDSQTIIIDITRSDCTDSDLIELVDCLIDNPDVSNHVTISNNPSLTDATGVKLAQYIASSTTLQTLDLSGNRFGTATYLAIAAALRINTSLRTLFLSWNQHVDRTRIDAAFSVALRFNRNRAKDSTWWLYSVFEDFRRLNQTTAALGPYSMLEQLRLCDRTQAKIKI